MEGQEKKENWREIHDRRLDVENAINELKLEIDALKHQFNIKLATATEKINELKNEWAKLIIDDPYWDVPF